MKSSIKDAVRRSHPSPERPRFRESIERKLAPLEAAQAVCYADSEAACARLDRLLADQGVVSGEIDIDESLAHHIEAVRRPPTEGS